MKKIYKTPNTKVVMAMINTNLLAGSDMQFGGTANTGQKIVGESKGSYDDWEED